jgi:hypothetical protein
MGVQYRIVIEPQEYDQYASVIDPEKILTLPFSNLGQGSIPARNWVWNHSIEEGHSRHWILDDNIESVDRFNHNRKIPVYCPAPFRAMEDFCDRYENIALAGPNYGVFCPAKECRPPVRFNIRVYSCILIQNEIPYRWRGRYNEDTDLSIRALKDGLCTALFNAFLIGKRATMSQGGGNTDELYAGDGRLRMAESLRDQHPDVVRVVQKFGRWHHQVDYRPFSGNKLRQVRDTDDSINEYGMRLERNDGEVPR